MGTDRPVSEIVDLDTMMEMQRALQSKINGYDIEDQSTELRIQNIALNVLALTDELHEALNETGWKPWATSRFINELELRMELIDAFHFLMNLFLHAGMSAADVWELYARKHGVNVDRQENGYDGVLGKCGRCRRDLATITLKEVIIKHSHFTGPRVDIYCVCGNLIGSRAV